MDTRPIIFLDSGIGGIPYCKHFQQNNPLETVFYLADRLNFPYGKKTRHQLAELLTRNVDILIRKLDPKIIVLACNTATVSGLKTLRMNFKDVLFVGTVPAIKPAALASKTKIVGVLATERTIKEKYIADLARRYGPCTLQGIAACELVDFVETRLDTASHEEKSEVVRGYLQRLREVNADVLVLGCTHYLYLADEFHQEAGSDIQVFDSVEGVCHRIEFLLDEGEGKLRTDSLQPGAYTLLLSGKDTPDGTWKARAEKLNFRLTLLEDL